MRITLTKATVGVVAVAALAAAALASPPSNPRYFEYTYFSDATLTVEVGYAVERCINGQIVMGQAVGTATAFYTAELIGRCPGQGGDY